MDEDSGQWDSTDLVRPYSLTGGRTQANSELDIATQVVARSGSASPVSDAVKQHILDCCRAPQSVAEVAVYVGLPVIVTKVLICDLIRGGLITASAYATSDGSPSQVTLARVLEGLRRL